MLGVIGMTEARTGAGLIGWRLEARLHAVGSQPLDGSFFSIAHFGATAARGGFMAVAVATDGGGGL